MKATINSVGVLVIASETELESYALKKWGEDAHSINNVIDGSKILLDLSIGAEDYLGIIQYTKP